MASTCRGCRIANGVIEDLARSESELRERLLVVELEREQYRELSKVAIAYIAELSTALDRTREQHHRLIDEYRTLREHVLQGTADQEAA